MTLSEIIMIAVASVLVIIVPWVGTLWGTRNFYKHLDDWRAKSITPYFFKQEEEEEDAVEKEAIEVGAAEKPEGDNKEKSSS